MIAYAEASFRQRGNPKGLSDLPYEVAHVWDWFLELSQARQYGMAANPISYAEIEAYSRLMRLRITPFETSLLRRLDMAALANAPKPKKAGESEIKNMTSAQDVEGVKGLLAGFNRRREAKTG